MTSHGRSKDGKRSPARERFFALSVNASSGQVGIVTEGNAYTALLSDLLASTNLAGLGLAEAAQPSLSKSKSLAPKAGGLNIEGLTVMPASSNLLIGFRNPVPHGRALLVPLLNPDDVIDRGAQARFGSPILLDLGGRGIRSIEYCPWRGDYLIAAGPVDEEEDFALYAWPGGQVRTAVRLPETVFIRGIKDFAPEALALDESTRRVFIATDDGSRDIPVASETECTVKTKNGTCPNKSLADPRRKTFRALLPGLE
ncbi:DUF3616 domain-containing protein [bacterium]|nr:DUF3616 domain-containing protein [bacterium]